MLYIVSQMVVHMLNGFGGVSNYWSNKTNTGANDFFNFDSMVINH